jgi:hypothetical protein
MMRRQYRGEAKMISRKGWPRIPGSLSGVGVLCITLAFSANSQVKTETKVEEGLPSQTVKIETAEVVYVSGSENDHHGKDRDR